MLHRALCAGALLATAAIHVAVVPEHQRDWPAAAAFFVVLALAEVGRAAAVWITTNRQVLLAGGVLSLASAALWSLSRTLGLPLGPEAFVPEAIAAPDVISTALEAATAVLFVRLASRASAPRIPALAHR